jgi:hypothetical protein
MDGRRAVEGALISKRTLVADVECRNLQLLLPRRSSRSCR